jgi:hypothetical protein
MSNEEIIEALQIKEGKKVKPITLPDDSNVVKGNPTAEQLEIQRLRNEIADIKRERLQEEQQRIHYDPVVQNRYMQRMTTIRDEQDQRKYIQLADADQRQKDAEEKAIKERLAKNEVYQQHLERIEQKKQKEIRKLSVYFSTDDFDSLIAEHKNPEDSPASYIIDDSTGAYRCKIHYQDKVMEPPANSWPRTLSSSTISLKILERHFRSEAERHKAACMEAITAKYQEMIDEKTRYYSRSEKALWRDELKEIEDLPGKTYAT